MGLWHWLSELFYDGYWAAVRWMIQPLKSLSQHKERDYVEHCIFDQLSSSELLRSRLEEYFETQEHETPVLCSWNSN
jgi:hypothetical protein